MSVIRLYLLALILFTPHSFAGFLPADSYQWWDTPTPATADFRSYDSLDAWFDYRLAVDYNFDQPSAQTTPLVRISTDGGGLATRQAITVREGGTIKTRTVLVNGPQVTAGAEEGDQYRPDMRFDFVVPQRAVVLEYGFLCNDDHDCIDSDGQTGMDARGVELIAYNREGFVIQRSNGEDSGPISLEPGRPDYHIGLRDQQGRIAAVALRLTDENARDTGPKRRAQAVQIVKRIHQEAMPYASVQEAVVIAGAQPLALSLPFHLDRATAIVRGFQFSDTSNILQPLLGFEYDVTTTVENGVALVSATGNAQFERPSGADQLSPMQVFVTVIAWDSTQTQIEVSDARSAINATGMTQETQSGTDPCVPFSDCGAAINNDWPSVAATNHMDFRFTELPGSSGEWSQWDLSLLSGVFRDTAAGQLHTETRLRPHADQSVGTFSLALNRRILSGNSIALMSNQHPDSFVLPEKSTLPRSLTEAAVSYSSAELANLDLSCAVDAPIAAIGLQHLIVRTDANGAESPGDGKKIRELDIEINGSFSRGHAAVSVAGGVDIGESLQANPLDGDHGQIFAVPVCIGLKASYPAANPITREARFISSQGQPATAHQVGKLTNFGDLPIRLLSAEFTGDAAEFQLELEYPGGNLGAPDRLQGRGGVTLNPGETMTVSGWFEPQSAAPQSHALRFQTNVGGDLAIEVPVLGRVSEIGGMFPENYHFGMATLSTPTTRRFNILATDIYGFTLFGFRIEGDVHQAFSVGQPNGPEVIPPGSGQAYDMVYVPRVAGDDRARIIAETDVGEFELLVGGIGVEPPSPALTALQRALTFGVLQEGLSRDATVRLRSEGRAAVAVTSIAIMGDGVFEIVNAPAMPIYLNHEESLELQVRFTPDSHDSSQLLRNGELVIVSDSVTGDIVIPMTGAVAPAP